MAPYPKSFGKMHNSFRRELNCCTTSNYILMHNSCTIQATLDSIDAVMNSAFWRVRTDWQKKTATQDTVAQVTPWNKH